MLIETIPAAFEMDEILYELREHASGLNAGRWDYLFSVIKYFRDAGPGFVLPDRGAVTMTAPMMRAYTDLLVATCHRRGAFAMGGMAAFIPSRRDPEINRGRWRRCAQDKEREAGDGFDGSWVAHPDLVPVCREVFDAVLGDQPNQLDRRRDDVRVADDGRPAAGRGVGARRDHRGRAARQHRRGPAVPGGLARRQRCGRHPQPDGGRGHRRDLPIPGVAVGAQPDAAGHRRDRDGRAGPGHRRRGTGRDRREIGETPTPRANTSWPGTVFEQVALADEFADFLTLPAYAAAIDNP